MPLRTRLFIIISIILLVVLGVSVFLLLRARQNKPTGGTSTTATSTIGGGGNGNQIGGGGAVPIKTYTSLEAEQNGVQQLAKIFVERYNTYSTDNNFQNIREVRELVTPTLWQKLSARLSASATNGPFMGVTTQVVTMTLTDWKDDSATVTMQAQKTTEKNGTTTQAYTTVTVKMMKQGGGWLVDSFK